MTKQLMNFFRPVISSVKDLLPIILVIGFFQLIVLQQPIPNIEKLLVGTGLVMLGLALFIKGLDIGLFPVGESMAYAFARKGNVVWLLIFAFFLGFGTTIAEPALIAVAKEAAIVAAEGGMIENTLQSQQSYSQGLRWTVALSVGIAIVIGVIRCFINCLMNGKFRGSVLN